MRFMAEDQDKMITLTLSTKEIRNLIGCIDIFIGETKTACYDCKAEHALMKKLKAILKT